MRKTTLHRMLNGGRQGSMKSGSPSKRKKLEALIGTGDGWYDGQGVFHEWTRESVDAAIAQYQETLESIKNGTLYSKDSEDDGDSYAMIPPTEDVESDYSVDVIREKMGVRSHWWVFLR